MPTQKLEKPKRGRLRKWLRRIAIGLAVLLLLSVLGSWIWYEYSRWQGKKELAVAIAETDAVDPRWRWEQLEEDKPQIADAENSIVVLSQFNDSLAGWNPKDLRMHQGEDLIAAGPANGQLSDEKRSLIKAAIVEHIQSVNVAFSLKNYTRGRSTINLNPNVLDIRLPHTDHAQKAAFLLYLYLEQLIVEQRWDDALDAIHAILSISSALKYDSVGISHVVRLGIRSAASARVERVLGMGAPSEVALKKLALHFGQELEENILSQAVRAERALIDKLFASIERDGKKFNEAFYKSSDLPPNEGLALHRAMVRANLPADHAFYLRLTRQAIDIARLPVAERFERWLAFDEGIRARHRASSITARLHVSVLSQPLISYLGESTLRDQARLQCTQAAIAAERYRIANKKWPDALDRLCPTFLGDVPTDPFNGNALRLAVRDDGIVVYSVGADRKDDGGNLISDKNNAPNTDIGLRLWNPDQRNRPAPKPARVAEE
jgi:hypothetical protein